MAAYLPIVFFALAAVGMVSGAMIAGRFLRPTPVQSRGKLEVYECGIEPRRDARQPFSVRFYIVAMLFLVFDVETIFLFPWAVQFQQLALFGLIEMFIFVAILLFGYFYAWQRGALEWV